MLPSMHPYVSKLAYGNKIIIVNPNSDYFSLPEFGVQFLEKNHAPNTYDIVHIHFSFDKMDFDKFKDVLMYFKRIGKPIVWTCHSKESQRLLNYHNGEYHKLLYSQADKVLTLTNGCKEWIEKSWGKHLRAIDVIAHGLIAMPEDVRRNISDIKKNHNRYTILYGEFRENKERKLAISEFLDAEGLADTELHLIYKNPVKLQSSSPIEWKDFMAITANPRCSHFVKSWIANDELIKEFYSSHCIILPYLWGTHSGQIELAKDCGCYIVASNVGFYREQWEKVILWGSECACKNYTEALKIVASSPSLKPIGDVRIDELLDIINRHLEVYTQLLRQNNSFSYDK